jgi:argonaute-like protein implicated in RNA metabolism and viral defense
METVYFTKVNKGENGYDEYQSCMIEGKITELDESTEYEGNPDFLAPYTADFTTIRVLAGKILTLIDASIDDPKKRKAMKGVARDAIADAHIQNGDIHYKRDPMIDSVAEVIETTDEELDSITAGV